MSNVIKYLAIWTTLSCTAAFLYSRHRHHGRQVVHGGEGDD